MKPISEQFEEIKEEMCDKYCRYPREEIPDGKKDGWLLEDDDSPCLSCPLNRL